MAPHLFLRQLAALAALVIARQVFWYGRRFWRSQTRWLRCLVSATAQREEDLRWRRRRCRDYASFKRLGEQLDTLQGLDKWKQDDSSKHFDAGRLRERTQKYKELMDEGDVEGCMFVLRQELLRKHFGVCNPALFSVCNQGTKAVVEKYTKTVCEAMTWVAFAHREEAHDLADPGDLGPPVTVQEKLAFFNETKHSFGRSALLLSGGAQLGMYHFGVVKALHTNGFLPRIISGTSAGSIVCGIVCCRSDAELDEMWRDDFQWSKVFNLNFFDGPNWGRFIKRGGEALYSSEHLAQVLKKNIGEETFLEAFDRTGRICNIPVSGLPGSTQYPMLLNYLTSPQILIWSAALASAAVPGIFEAKELLSKDRFGNVVPYFPGGLKWQDGSMQNDLPMHRLTELFNVNYFIVSQVNPHAQFFSGGGYGSAKGPVFRLSQFLRREIKQYMLSMMELMMGTAGGRVSPWLRPVGLGAVSLIVQEYEGDVTIFSGRGLIDIASMLNNGNEEVMRQYTAKSEWETWWTLPRIENACAIEFVMDEIIKELRGELLEQRRGAAVSRSASRKPSKNSDVMFQSAPLLKRVISQDMGVERLPSFHQQFLQAVAPDERVRLGHSRPAGSTGSLQDSMKRGAGRRMSHCKLSSHTSLNLLGGEDVGLD